jgi:hypothetical protein
MSWSGFSCRRLVFAGIVLAIAAGCSNKTSTTQLWQAQGVVRAPMKHIVVFAGGLNETGQRTIEDGFVSALAQRGVDAKPAYAVFPRAPEKDSARAALQAAGYDGVIVSTVRSASEQPRYVPGSPTASSGFWDGPYWNGGVYAPGYPIPDELVNVETKVWDLRANGTLVWSATTLTTNPSSTGDEAKSIAKELVPKLSDGGLIPAKS